MERARLAALRRKLANPSRATMADVAHQIAREGESFPKEILKLFVAHLLPGNWIDLNALQSAVIAARDRELYLASKPFLGSLSQIIELLKARLPDASIEEQLCDELWNCKRGDDNDNVRRRFITEALRDYGTLGCLDALEGLLYDLKPGIDTARVAKDATKCAVISDDSGEGAEQFLGDLRREVEIEYGQLLKDAIAAIRARNQPPRDAWNLGQERADVCAQFGASREYVEQAERNLSASRLAAALYEMRRATEAMLKAALRNVGVLTNPKGESIDGLMLGELVPMAIRNLELRKVTSEQLDLIRRDTNIGSHDQQLPESDYLTPAIVKGVIGRFKIVEAQLAKRLLEC